MRSGGGGRQALNGPWLGEAKSLGRAEREAAQDKLGCSRMTRSTRHTGRSGRAFAIAAAIYGASIPARATVPLPTDPETGDAARELGYQGVDAFDRGEWERARQYFHQAYQLVPAPTLAIREADALVKLARLVEAKAVYERIAKLPIDNDSPRAFREAVERAGIELQDLEHTVPRLTVRFRPGPRAGARVLIDELVRHPSQLDQPLLLDPGNHHLEVYGAHNQRILDRNVVLRRGQHEVVVAVFDDPPTEAPSTQRTIGWASIAVGGAGTAVGVATGLLAAKRRDSLDERCMGDVCPESAQGEHDTYRSLRTVSFVGYGVGLLGVGLGATLLLTSSGANASDEPAGVRPWIGLGSAGIGGRF
jgi:hypothetical protein